MIMIDAAAAVRDAALERIAAASSAEQVRALDSELLGKKGRLAQLKTQLGSLATADEKKAAGQALNEALGAVTAALEARRGELFAAERAVQLQAERLDLTEVMGRPSRGHAHVVTQAWERLEDVFIGLGFQVAEGPEAETDWHNFEALNMPADHPARSMHDTFYVDHGAPGSTVMRTHTSPVQIRVMQTAPPPIYAIMPGRVFRNETADSTHVAVFHQLEGLVIDRNIGLADLAGTIEAFTKAFFGEAFTSRLRPSYFPFTEPSAEFDIQTPSGQWLELGGCGVVHPNVLRAGGIDPEEWSGFAFGFGIDRMAKERHGIGDLREMYTNDLRFLEQF
jgi:phenylalanyl-tRNA synthetase alpha chain